MTAQQRTALRRPALIAEECAHPRYRNRTRSGTVIITVDSGYE